MSRGGKGREIKEEERRRREEGREERGEGERSKGGWDYNAHLYSIMYSVYTCT